MNEYSFGVTLESVVGPGKTRKVLIVFQQQVTFKQPGIRLFTYQIDLISKVQNWKIVFFSVLPLRIFSLSIIFRFYENIKWNRVHAVLCDYI